jgi:hypothetical protein
MATKLSEQGGIDLHGGFVRQMMIHSGLVSFGLVWFGLVLLDGDDVVADARCCRQTDLFDQLVE